MKGSICSYISAGVCSLLFTANAAFAWDTIEYPIEAYDHENCEYRLKWTPASHPSYSMYFSPLGSDSQTLNFDMKFNEYTHIVSDAQPSNHLSDLLQNPDFTFVETTIRATTGQGNETFIADAIVRMHNPNDIGGMTHGNFSFATHEDQLKVQSKCVAVEEGISPWRANEAGTLVTNRNYTKSAGYHFIPDKDGAITELAGFFQGTKTIKLWRRDTGELLAEADVTANNSWGKIAIEPVQVEAGVEYTVSTYLAGSGGTYRLLSSNLFPKQYGDILITGSSIRSGDGRPTNSYSRIMFGQVDIQFTPN